MRNIPLAFLDEETLDHLASQQASKTVAVNGFEKLAEAQMLMRGTHSAPALWESLRSAAKWGVAQLEKMVEMSGPNSIANLERAMRSYKNAGSQARKAN